MIFFLTPSQAVHLGHNAQLTTQELVRGYLAARKTLEKRRRHLQAALWLLSEASLLTPETFAGLDPVTQRRRLSEAQAADRMFRSILRKSP